MLWKNVVLVENARDIVDRVPHQRVCTPEARIVSSLVVVQSRIQQYFGRGNESIVQLVVWGKVKGTKYAAGHLCAAWTDQVKFALESCVSDSARQLANRNRWLEIVRRAVSASTNDVTTTVLPRVERQRGRKCQISNCK